MPILAAGSTATISLLAQQRLALRISPTAYAVLETQSGLSGKEGDQHTITSPAWERSWPEPGTLTLTAYGAPLDYSLVGNGVGSGPSDPEVPFLMQGGSLIAGLKGRRAATFFGQSNERGSARNWAGPGNQATLVLFEGLNALLDPVPPSVTSLGSVLPHLDYALRGEGYRMTWRNCAIGGLSFIKQACGQVNSWQANTTYYGQRASIGTGDAGDYGDVIAVGTRVLRCTTGALRYATNSSGVAIPNGAGAVNIDYIMTPVASDRKTGAAQPVSDVGGRAMSAAIVGDTFTETPSGMVWTCLSTTLGTLSAFKVLASGETGNDPHLTADQYPQFAEIWRKALVASGKW